MLIENVMNATLTSFDTNVDALAECVNLTFLPSISQDKYSINHVGRALSTMVLDDIVLHHGHQNIR